METKEKMKTIFGKLNSNGTVGLFITESGNPLTSFEFPEGIIFTRERVENLNIEIK